MHLIKLINETYLSPYSCELAFPVLLRIGLIPVPLRIGLPLGLERFRPLIERSQKHLRLRNNSNVARDSQHLQRNGLLLWKVTILH